MTSGTLDGLPESEVTAGLYKLAALPAWLLAPLQAKPIAAALRQVIPEFVSGALELKSCKIKRMLLKGDGHWAGTYALGIEGPEGKQSLALRGTFTPPALRTTALPAATPNVPLGAEGWRLVLPEFGLELVPEPPESELAAMPLLTDAEAARAMLEQGIRENTYPDMQIASCQPEVLSYKPGSRCTLRYHLAYPPELAARGWPASVIAKTYRKDSKGRNAYEGMVALWKTPLASGSTVTLAEPLAYIPEHKVMVQGPVPAEQSLEDMLKDALTADTPEAYAELHGYMIRTAAALAAFHQSGVRYGATVTLDERWAELHELQARLSTAVPELNGVVTPLLEQLEARAIAAPPDAAVPTHGTFNPEQVLISGPHIGIIDFDDFCMAEPALDVGLFIAAIKDIGMNVLDDEQARNLAARRARLARLDAIGDVFLTFYERLAPISRERVALWQAWSYLRDTLHFWVKAKPAEPDNGLLMLVSLLQHIGIFPPPDPQAAAAVTEGARRRAGIPSARYMAYASALLGGLAVRADDLSELLGMAAPLLG
jgi:hypothetical protein